MAELKAADQLRARGSRSADGAEITAEEVVAGSFRNIAGTIKAIDASNNTIIVQDAISKSAVVVSVSRDSQMKKLTPENAQRIAMRLKAASGSGNTTTNNEAQNPGQSRPASSPPTQSTDLGGAQSNSGERSRGSGSGYGGGNGPPDLQRILSRMPNSTLADLKAGDAVMIVATEGGGSEKPTAITLLAGVEPILTAAPNRSAASLLSPWSLSAPSGEGEAAP
jgi:Tfp pilus assembly protein PilX